jgi:type VI secretion system protein ImpF
MSPSQRRRSTLLERLASDADMDGVQVDGCHGSSAAELRESVRRELAFLFNATALTAIQGLDLYPHVARSVLNYGVPDLSGKTASSIDRPWLERTLTWSIRNFEPRIRPDSVQVNVSATGPTAHNTLTLKIDADLSDQPNEKLQIETEFDLESGTAMVTDRRRLA